MIEPAASPFLVPFDGSFRLDTMPTGPKKGEDDDDANEKRLEELLVELDELQRTLYACDTWSVLLVFQAMDAAGKDGTIRAVMRGVDPAGCQVYAFKAPSPEDLDHDFLWRTSRALPERGRIGIFNRSYYEEVLVVKVHPEYLARQKLPGSVNDAKIFEHRYESIRDHEKHLARSGMLVLKFWLNVSQKEQKKRFLKRIDEPEKNWKFNEGDVAESLHWEEYMAAYQEALAATSRKHAPWYAIPADDKRYMRRQVAEVLVANLKKLDLCYPDVDDARRAKLLGMRKMLEKTKS